jgi:hypothetical protein
VLVGILQIALLVVLLGHGRAAVPILGFALLWLVLSPWFWAFVATALFAQGGDD